MTAIATARLASAHARLLQDNTIQLSFVSYRDPPVPDWAAAFGRWLQSALPVLQGGFWVVLGGAGLVILGFLVREFLLYRRPTRRKAAALTLGSDEWRPDASRARALLEDADRLAGQGLFAEAAHVLLFRSIDDIQQKRPRLIVPALTSRDIASLEALPGAAKAAFGLIANHVEVSAFGGRGVDANGFAACRAAYAAFAFPETWRTA